MTKILAAIFALFLFFSQLNYPINAQSKSASVTIESLSALVEGQSAIFNLYLDTKDLPTSGLSLNLNFNPEYIKIQEINPTNSFSTTISNKHDNSLGIIDLQLLSLSPTDSLPKGKIQIAEIKADVLKSQKNIFNLQNTSQAVGNQSGQAVSLSLSLNQNYQAKNSNIFEIILQRIFSFFAKK